MIEIYSQQGCAHCEHAKNYLRSHGLDFTEIDITNNDAARQFLRDQGHRSLPQIYHDGRLLIPGGWTRLNTMTKNDILHMINTL